MLFGGAGAEGGWITGSCHWAVNVSGRPAVPAYAWRQWEKSREIPVTRACVLSSVPGALLTLVRSLATCCKSAAMDSADGLATRLWAEQSGCPFSTWARESSVLRNVQTGSGAHRAPYSVGIRFLSRG